MLREGEAGVWEEKRKCLGERERAFEREREDAEKEMKWRLGGKKRNSLFPP